MFEGQPRRDMEILTRALRSILVKLQGTMLVWHWYKARTKLELSLL